MMSELRDNLADLPPLTEEERQDAALRIKDRLWAAIGELFDQYEEQQGLSYASLGRRIGRTRAQVQHWLDRPVNMTAASAGLLAEGLDAELRVLVSPRTSSRASNRAHPSEEARADLAYVLFVDDQILQPLASVEHTTPDDQTSAIARPPLLSHRLMVHAEE